MYLLPMVIEESSVVAAASSAARFWAERGGFKAHVVSNIKNGQLHFLYKGDPDKLKNALPELKSYLLDYAKPVTGNMEARGGGIVSIELNDRSTDIPNYFQLDVGFNTQDAMGANFINSCLEEFSSGIQQWLNTTEGFSESDYEPVMAILSNYNDSCLVNISVSCNIDALDDAAKGLDGHEFARRFALAVNIAGIDVHRATTHNKGIMNGVDALILATGNDFRAIEAGAHAWAARSGKYSSLSRVELSDNHFSFILEMPMALGTVGGLTGIHPLAAHSLEMLGKPGAEELMMIAAAAGLANNFAAVRSLTTTGIQAGHMKMHLSNILLQLKATPDEVDKTNTYFKDKKVSHQAVAAYLTELRK
jgi:hydroxymethylglutaryl-CoA reductase